MSRQGGPNLGQVVLDGHTASDCPNRPNSLRQVIINVNISTLAQGVCNLLAQAALKQDRAWIRCSTRSITSDFGGAPHTKGKNLARQIVIFETNSLIMLASRASASRSVSLAHFKDKIKSLDLLHPIHPTNPVGPYMPRALFGY